MKNRGGQVTIFIIIAILLVVAVALFFLLRSDVSGDTGINPTENPEAFLKICLEDEIYSITETLGKQGGYIEPILKLEQFMFTDEGKRNDVTYLCYTLNYYEPCVNQRPMLIEHLKNEIHDEIKSPLNTCFEKLEASYEKAGYDVVVNYSPDYFDIDLVKGQIIITADREITTTKGDQVSTEDNFKLSFASKFYDIANVAQEILSQEARFCNFNEQGYTMLYPYLSIDKYKLTTGDGSSIYTVKYKSTGEMFRFVVRSCVIPPGFG